MKKGILILVIFGFTTSFVCSQPQKTKNINNKLEKELLMIKNQLFINLYNRSLSVVKGEVTPPDGSSYMQISDLYENYWMDKNANRLLNRWSSKKYISFDPKQKLYLMRCLDFYNSEDLKQYIDSIRKVELKRHKH